MAQLNDRQKLQVLMALSQLPPLATVKQIREKTGLVDLSAPALRPMASAGLIVQSDVKEAPSVRFDLAPAGRQLAVAHQTGNAVTVPEDTRPTDGPLNTSKGEVREALRRRFAGGEGETAESRRKLADEFGVTASVVAGVRAQWLQRQFKPEPPNSQQPTQPEGNKLQPEAAGAAEAEHPTNAEPKPVQAATSRISPEDRDRLYARFAAGEGQAVESRKALGHEFGLLSSTVAYHLGRWEKAGRPNPAANQPYEPADPPVDPLHEPGKDPTCGQVPAESQCSVSTPAPPETEHPADHDHHAPQGAAFDAGADTPETEHPAPPETATEPQAASTDPAASSTENPGASTPPAPPDTAMAHALAKAGIVPTGTGTQVQAPQVKPGRRLRCQVCHEPVDTFLWYTDTKSGLSGHKGCVQPAAALQDEERLPVAGQICEGTVFTVDAGGMYALIELTEFSDPRRHRFLRGKATRAQVLRHGWCEDVRDWLQDGDLVNVKVLDISADPAKRRYRINLSIKQAPPHGHERIPLEVNESAPPEEPIVARGAEVVATLATEPASPGPVELPAITTSTGEMLGGIISDLAEHPPTTADSNLAEAAIAAADLCRRHHLDPRHVDDLTERILVAGIPQVTAELEADLATLANLKVAATTSAAEPATPTGTRTITVDATPEWIARQERAAALEQAAAALSNEDHDVEHVAERIAPQLHDQLLAAQLEIEQLRAALSAKRAEARRMVRGLCPSCFHGIDGFCPYADMVAETYELPEEDRPERHRDRRIVFGRRPVIDCDLYRGDGTAAD
jgi:predicted RNA-binding protein with RPS1 domain